MRPIAVPLKPHAGRPPRLAVTLILLAAVGTCVSGCGDDGEGAVAVTAYGEPFVEEGIPASEMDDDWAVTFERFAVVIADVEIGGVALDETGPVDLAVPSAGAGHALGTLTLAAGRYTDARFTIAGVEVRGAATKDGVTKTFDWVFEDVTHYVGCEATTRVRSGETTALEITVHADHLFYDSLVAEEPALLFQALADADDDNDGDGDGEITRAELESTDIGAYDPGNADIDDLWAWLRAHVRTLGHVDGEGHCESEASD